MLLRRVLAGIVLFFLAYFGILLLAGWLTDWSPEGTNTLPVQGTALSEPAPDTTLSVCIWNVGYGGLGASADFFFDDEGMMFSGSSMVHAPKPMVESHIGGAVRVVQENPADFWMLQEVDVDSDRSYRINQSNLYAEALPGYAATFAANYQCARVPIPLLEPWHPYGRVVSGLGTYARFQPVVAERVQLPGQQPMPKRLFELDRCLAVHRFPTAKGPELVLVNVHNSAYDRGDKIKSQQMAFVRDFAVAEFNKGNYVVLGGDWNQCPPNVRFDMFTPEIDPGYTISSMPIDFFPENWHYAYDPTTPTNRSAKDPYVSGKTFLTLIDYFLVSPNVHIISVKGITQEFLWSDHQPVRMTFRLQ